MHIDPARIHNPAWHLADIDLRDPAVFIRRDGRWFMLYSASLAHQKIAWAVSDDLTSWEKGGLCDVPEFPASASRFGAPFITEGIDDANRTYMIYQGEGLDGRMSFRLLASHDLIHWSIP